MMLNPFTKRSLLLVAAALLGGLAWSHIEHDGQKAANNHAEAADTVCVADTAYVDDSWARPPVASLSECTTLDSAITRRSREALLAGLRHFKGNLGQLAVVDAATGELKCWVSLKLKRKSYADAPLLLQAANTTDLITTAFAAHLHTKGLKLTDTVDVDNGIYHRPNGETVRDNNWRSGGYGCVTWHYAFTHRSRVAAYRALEKAYGRDEANNMWFTLCRHSKDEGNAMDMAAMVNSLYSHDCQLRPSLTGGAPRRIPYHRALDAQGLADVRTVLRGCFADGGIYAPYASKHVTMAGCFAYDTEYAPDRHGEDQLVVASTCFMGTFPADHPRYAIGLFIDRPTAPVPSARQTLEQVVNPLAEWLVKH